ncbi:flavin-dependent oxidoreductase [Limobrevibacterium gyesilva]|uniref:Flavin-dependent oxidoreductase n=1 Tax=Limobrevibacterium gyesilva TaxID=2991712 RepID=A0AA42CDA1_9PROT|nr:flavin-dependent oxidoreductase [Limobrevibacterium gyesilva]MCW3473509.1 flavin-dependent oxidoreductase [Limobrevibacterium gyesilva]
MTILIAGGGIGGLTLALSLHERGIPCIVFEQADQLRPLGVGINTLPHAIKELADLGLLPALDAVGIRTHELIYVNRFGQEVWREKRGLHAGHSVPQFSIHRGHLQGVLWQAAAERLPAGTLRTGHHLSGFTQDADGITATFTDRAGNTVATERGAALVAADGIHSAARAILHPEDPGIRWQGIMMWRGAIDAARFLDGDSMVIAGDMQEKLVLYPIARAADGRRLTNWVVCIKAGDGSTPPPRREDWSRVGALDDILPTVRRFRLPFLDIEALVRATPEFFEYPMCDRDPLPWWTQGRVTLLGDAAHPMYPVGSNGASQAILDARLLARLLDEADAPAALAAYEADRLPKTAEIVRLNRMGGPERVVDVVSARAPDGFDRLEDVISREELAAIAGGYAVTAGFAKV